MADAGEPVLLTREEGVAVLTLNRPAARNALDTPLKETLLALLRELHDDAAVRAVVLTGAGAGFCVGQDLREHAGLLRSGEALDTVTLHYNPIVEALAALPKPVIAAVNGAAAGAGFGLACACDLRLAADDAIFLTAFAGIGLSADSGLSFTLPRLVGAARATALLLLSEPVSAEQALAMGLVSAVTPPESLLPAALELAGRLAAGPTRAYAAIKQAVLFSATNGLHESLGREALLQRQLGGTQDHQQAVEAFLAKQPPRFSGR